MTDFLTASETHAVLRAHAEKTERGDRPARQSLDALRADGDFALRTPKAFGGAWADAQTVGRRLADLGRACPSTAWIAGTCVTAKNVAARSFSEAQARPFFADPDALFCGSGLPTARGERIPGGVRVRGQWANISGCEDAAFAGLALSVEDTFSYALIPATDLAVERTWQMAGMRGTGSHTLVADDIVVPADQVVAMAPFTLRDLLLYRTTVLGPLVGAARGALDAIEAMFASDHKPHMTAYSRMGESSGARHWLGQATHLVNRAEATMLSVAATADSPELRDADGSRLRMDLAGAGRDCRDAVELMLDLHGASGFKAANVLQRFWRDVAVGSRHPLLNPYLATEAFGAELVALTGEPH